MRSWRNLPLAFVLGLLGVLSACGGNPVASHQTTTTSGLSLGVQGPQSVSQPQLADSSDISGGRLSLLVSPSSTEVRVGSFFVYTIAVTNGTPTALSGVTATINLPAGVDGVDKSPNCLGQHFAIFTCYLGATANNAIPTSQSQLPEHMLQSATVTVEVTSGGSLVATGFASGTSPSGSLSANSTSVAVASSASTTGEPAVTASPADGLRDGQEVRVSVSGFAPNQKIWLSECAAPEDISWAGCGPGLPAQPFLFTDSSGNASQVSFTVSATAHNGPESTASSLRCTSQCIIVATAGNNGVKDLGIAYAEISFTTT